MSYHFSIVVPFILLFSTPAAFAQGCSFSERQQKFAGSPVEQARCLLRKVLPGGTVAQTPASISPFFQSSLGKPVALTKGQLSKYLQKLNVSDSEIGGQIGKTVSESRGGTRALYFVIHDTSDDISGSSFPSEINSPSYGLNRLNNRDVGMTHVMISRAGDSRTGHAYSGELTATKFERYHGDADGLFLHNELVQPRIRGGFAFHAVGPRGGFSAPQMKRLALLYIVASVRRGLWMIPAFHADLDEGIPDGHDDPQNFDLALWQQIVEQVYSEATDSVPVKEQPAQKPETPPQPVPEPQPDPVEPQKPIVTPKQPPVTKPKQPGGQGECLWYAVASCDRSENSLARDQAALGADFTIIHTDSISGFAHGWYCLVSGSQDRAEAVSRMSAARKKVNSVYVKKGCQ